MGERPQEFQLCRSCRDRQGAGLEISLAETPERCFICAGLSEGLAGIAGKTVSVLRGYEFKTFSVGLVLPTGVQEREDTLRSELKARGRETIKSEIAGRLSKGIARELRGKKVDRLNPDATVLADLGSGVVSVSTKPLYLYCRYTKPRGVAQRRLFCEECAGRGCDKCKGTGYSNAPSVEGLVARRLGKALGSKRFKFTWFGSEDADSIVFPPGRPMAVESKNPRRRHAPRSLRLRTGKGGMEVSGIRPVGRKFEHPAFTFMTRASIVAERRVAPEDLRALQRGMRNALVQYRNNKGRMVDKRIYFVKATARGKRITAEIKLDGGLPVKRLVSGEAVSPSLSESMKMPLRCERFDIVRVWPQTHPRPS